MEHQPDGPVTKTPSFFLGNCSQPPTSCEQQVSSNYACGESKYIPCDESTHLDAKPMKDKEQLISKCFESILNANTLISNYLFRGMTKEAVVEAIKVETVFDDLADIYGVELPKLMKYIEKLIITKFKALNTGDEAAMLMADHAIQESRSLLKHYFISLYCLNKCGNGECESGDSISRKASNTTNNFMGMFNKIMEEAVSLKSGEQSILDFISCNGRQSEQFARGQMENPFTPLPITEPVRVVNIKSQTDENSRIEAQNLQREGQGLSDFFGLMSDGSKLADIVSKGSVPSKGLEKSKASTPNAPSSSTTTRTNGISVTKPPAISFSDVLEKIGQTHERLDGPKDTLSFLAPHSDAGEGVSVKSTACPMDGDHDLGQQKVRCLPQDTEETRISKVEEYLRKYRQNPQKRSSVQFFIHNGTNANLLATQPIGCGVRWKPSKCNVSSAPVEYGIVEGNRYGQRNLPKLKIPVRSPNGVRFSWHRNSPDGLGMDIRSAVVKVNQKEGVRKVYEGENMKLVIKTTKDGKYFYVDEFNPKITLSGTNGYDDDDDDDRRRFKFYHPMDHHSLSRSPIQSYKTLFKRNDSFLVIVDCDLPRSVSQNWGVKPFSSTQKLLFANGGGNYLVSADQMPKKSFKFVIIQRNPVTKKISKCSGEIPSCGTNSKERRNARYSYKKTLQNKMAVSWNFDAYGNLNTIGMVCDT